MWSWIAPNHWTFREIILFPKSFYWKGRPPSPFKIASVWLGQSPQERPHCEYSPWSSATELFEGPGSRWKEDIGSKALGVCLPCFNESYFATWQFACRITASRLFRCTSSTLEGGVATKLTEVLSRTGFVWKLGTAYSWFIIIIFPPYWKDDCNLRRAHTPLSETLKS